MDIISSLHESSLDNLIEQIFGYLDYEELSSAELVCKLWRKIIIDREIWHKFLQKMLAFKKSWNQALGVLMQELVDKETDDASSTDSEDDPLLFRRLCNGIIKSPIVSGEGVAMADSTSDSGSEYETEEEEVDSESNCSIQAD